MIRIAIDAMGGDFGPEPIIEGVLEALDEGIEFTPVLVGNKRVIKKFLPDRFVSKMEIVNAKDVIEMKESASVAIKRKDSSIYVACNLLKEGKVDCLVSAGHSGSTMAVALLLVGRSKGVLRPAICTTMPTGNVDKKSIILDVGANVDSKPEHLYQFALMGMVYAKYVRNIRSPKIGLLSNGEEKSKGNTVSKATYDLLEKESFFIGNVEGGDVFKGTVDVTVCDGFVGNILLKTAEGMSSAVNKLIKGEIKKSFMAMIGSVFMFKAFNGFKKTVNYSEYGGAPLLGVKKTVIISHGKSDSLAIKNAILQAKISAEENLSEHIEKEIAKREVSDK